MASSSLITGDYIGMESCVDLIPDPPDDLELLGFQPQRRRRNHRDPVPPPEITRRMKAPPPIPALARTENLSSHMPWVMRRYYSGDGRLVIREEKVRHHEYFMASRSNGRLTLRLVPLDDAVWPPPPPLAAVNREDSISSEDDSTPAEIEADEDSGQQDSPPSTAETIGISSPSARSGAGKCSEYESMATSPCIFRMPVVPLRPIHS